MSTLKNIVSRLLLLLVLTFPAGSALAIQLTLSPSTQNVILGNSVVVDVGITGLGDFSPDSLGVYDIDILFDPAILDFDSVLFGDPVLGSQLDLFGFGSFTDVIPSIGLVNLFELSLDFASDLDSLQAGAFTLASLTFHTLSAGSSLLDIQINVLGDAFGLPLAADISTAGINVVNDTPPPPPPPNPLPEPNMLLLLAAGLLGLFMNSYHDKKRDAYKSI